ncbi:MAG: response regulator transcription factor [Verrucomicrobiota bacterium]|nr:response regulator transcription factor [Verrucomicrobiota bacterium]
MSEVYRAEAVLVTGNNETADSLRRVAVVDDDEPTRLYFQDILRSAKGFMFAGAFSNAIQALKGIPQLRPDLVLMDIRLPGLNGIECLKQLKQVLAGLKIIVMTGMFNMDLIESALRAGADGFLTKPVAVEQCLATLRVVDARQREASPNRQPAEWQGADGAP